MGFIPDPKMTFIFPISCILVLIFLFFMIRFPKCEGKGSLPKSKKNHCIYLYVINQLQVISYWPSYRSKVTVLARGPIQLTDRGPVYLNNDIFIN